MKIGIIDYGMGNLRSVQGALEFLGASTLISADPNDLAASDKLVLPGVGSFAEAMNNLNSSGLREFLASWVLAEGRQLLGICLGMQLLAESGEEDGPTNGLGWIPGHVSRFSVDESKYPVPHVGFSNVAPVEGESLFKASPAGADFYFVHSYKVECTNERDVIGWSDYGGTRFAAAVRKNNVFGVQFHPEKSQTNGLKLLASFVEA